MYTIQVIYARTCPSRPLGCSEADDVLQKCERVLEILDRHDEDLFTQWTEGLEETCETHLREPLLTLDIDTGLFQINFSPAVSTKSNNSATDILNILVRLNLLFESALLTVARSLTEISKAL